MSELTLVARARITRVGVDDALRHQRQFSQNRTVPLHNMLERMAFGFLEIVAAVQRIKPSVQEKFGPVGVADEQAPASQTIAILREDEIDALAFEVREGFDDAVRGHDGLVGDHEGF